MYDGRIAWVAFYAVLILPMLSLLYLFISSRKLVATHSASAGHIIKGDELAYKVTLSNAGFLPVFCVRVQFENEADDFLPFTTQFNMRLVPVGRRQTIDVVFPLECLYRGEFGLKAHSVDIVDVLGLFSLKIYINERLSVLVYPALKDVKNIPLSAVNTSDAPSIRETPDEDYAIVTDLRKYQPDDSFKRIHWKISAKKNELMIKNFQSVNLNAAVLALNNNEIPFDRPFADVERLTVEDKLVEGLLSFAHYALMRRFPVELLYMEDGLQHVTESSFLGFDNVYNICAKVAFDNTADFKEHLGNYMHGQTEFINIVIFTAGLSWAFCEQLRMIKAAGHNVILFFAETRRGDMSPSLSDELSALLYEAGIIVYYLPMESAVEEVVS